MAFKLLLLVAALQAPAIFSAAQTRFSTSSVSLLISGTSTLHDWTMKSAKADGTVLFDLGPDGQITGIRSLVFSTPANALKSEHTGMDNNAYKALKSDQFPVISYTMTSAAVTHGPDGSAIIKCAGTLSLAGATRQEDIVAICRTNPDNSIIVTGSTRISMQDFRIDPPTFMLGTIKTGNEIVLTFNIVFRKS